MRHRTQWLALGLTVAAACSIRAVRYLPDDDGGTPGCQTDAGAVDCTDPDCAELPACQARCGDGKLDPGEVCDDGNTVGGDGCSADCRSRELCGNAVVDPGEECDLGSSNSNNADCRSDCVVNRCGDGFPDTQGTHREDCDGGAPARPGDRTVSPTETAQCNLDCTAARCGDGKVNQHFKPPGATQTEQCDDGNTINGDACEANCSLPVCGNGIRDRNEQCDAGGGTPHDTASCDLDCTLPLCGDGHTNAAAGEECDDGANNSDSRRCTASCKLNVCGDGHVLAGVEQCDPGGGTPRDTAACDSDCTLVVCGDGHVNSPAGEVCDEGANNGRPGHCNATCTGFQ